MKIVGLLSWYDESPGWLGTAVAGFARVCDTIVALDGAYALYPGARACSHPNQAETIMQAAEASGAGCIIHRPNEVWRDNELGKRNQLLRLAGSLDLTTDDWLIVFDADCHILRISPDNIRAKLAATDLPIATYTYLDGKDFLSDPKIRDQVRDHEIDTEWTGRTRDVFRWDPTLRVGLQHWLYSAERDGERVWIRGPESQDEACQLDRDLVIYHRTADRAKVRRDAQAYYYKLREQHGVEWLENHDPPSFDQKQPEGVTV